MSKKRKAIVVILLTISIVGVIVGSLILMLIWNALMPALFALSTMSYGQAVMALAWLLLLFVSIFFKSSK